MVRTLERFLSTLDERFYPEAFRRQRVGRSFVDLLSCDTTGYDLAPADDEQWLRVLSLLAHNERRHGRELRHRYETGADRVALTRDYLSHQDSFLFMNVGTFHTGIYPHVMEQLHQRLSERGFRYLVSSGGHVMKNAKGHNEFFETLLQYKDKGLIVNTVARQPLHFISVIYRNGGNVRVELSFEDDHEETQDVRHRFFPQSAESIARLYATQLLLFKRRGKLVRSWGDVRTYRCAKSHPEVLTAEQGAVWWYNHAREVTATLGGATHVAVGPEGVKLRASSFEELFAKMAKRHLKPAEDVYVTSV